MNNAFTKKMRFIYVLILSGMFMGTGAFAQKTDSVGVSLRPKIKPTSKFSVGKTPSSSWRGLAHANASGKPQKLLTVLKIYPNPVSTQINVNLKLERESNISIKITDILGNDVVQFTNERLPAGEFTKTFPIPEKVNTGIYFLRIVAGGEPIIKRISVL